MNRSHYGEKYYEIPDNKKQIPPKESFGQINFKLQFSK